MMDRKGRLGKFHWCQGLAKIGRKKNVARYLVNSHHGRSMQKGIQSEGKAGVALERTAYRSTLGRR
jgi:hypothetical protein